MKDKINILTKKWWFWGIIILLFFGIIGIALEDEEKQDVLLNNEQHEEIKYTLTGEETGEYGKKIILNANSDMPTTKYVYKLPEGNYEVTTTFDKLAAFFIVKDEISLTGAKDYPEELNYVGEQYSLTNGNDDYNGKAKHSVNITINNDESILINGKETFVFKKQ